MSRVEELIKSYLQKTPAELRSKEDKFSFKQMKEIAEVRSGWTFPKNFQGRTEGEIPFFKVSDMNTSGNETEISIAHNYIDAKTATSLGVKAAPQNTIIFPKVGAAIGTNKKRITRQPSAYDNNVMGLIPNRSIVPKYLFHWMQKLDLMTLASASGALPSITKSKVEKILVPVPPLEVQDEIVRILDSFTQLEAELEAELEARRKQYEYYRDSLLSFENLESRLGGATLSHFDSETLENS